MVRVSYRIGEINMNIRELIEGLKEGKTVLNPLFWAGKSGLVFMKTT